MNSLAFSTLPCEGWSVEELIDACRKYGFTGIELREGEGSVVTMSTPKEELKRIDRLFKEANIKVTNIGTSICVKGTKNDAAKLGHLQQAAELAQALGAEGLRIFLGNFARRRDARLEQLDHSGIVSWLQEACDIAASYGTAVWVETHNEYAVGSVLRKLLDEVGRENCGVIYDIIHPLEDGEAPEDTVRLLGEQCVHVHMKDGVPLEDPMEHDWKYTVIGEGQLPVPRIVECLRNSGYKGYFSLEWETKWRSELQAPGMDPHVIFPHYTRYMNSLFQKQEDLI